MASDIVGDAKDEAKDNTYSAYTVASDKTNQAMYGAYGKAQEAGEAMKDKASDAYGFSQTIRMVSDKADDVKEMSENAMSHGKDKAFETYEDAKSKLRETSGL